MATSVDKPIANSMVVLREEFDDWAVLFDPNTGKGFGLNPMSVFVWKRLDGQHTAQDIVAELRSKCQEMPDNAEEYVRSFVQSLVDKGLAGYPVAGA